MQAYVRECVRRLTKADRVAATECVHLMGLLAASGAPHSEQLAALIGLRLVALVDDGVGARRPMSDGELAPWVEIGRRLQDGGRVM